MSKSLHNHLTQPFGLAQGGWESCYFDRVFYADIAFLWNDMDNFNLNNVIAPSAWKEVVAKLMSHGYIQSQGQAQIFSWDALQKHFTRAWQKKAKISSHTREWAVAMMKRPPMFFINGWGNGKRIGDIDSLKAHVKKSVRDAKSDKIIQIAPVLATIGGFLANKFESGRLTANDAKTVHQILLAFLGTGQNLVLGAVYGVFAFLYRVGGHFLSPSYVAQATDALLMNARMLARGTCAQATHVLRVMIKHVCDRRGELISVFQNFYMQRHKAKAHDRKTEMAAMCLKYCIEKFANDPPKSESTFWNYAQSFIKAIWNSSKTNERLWVLKAIRTGEILMGKDFVANKILKPIDEKMDKKHSLSRSLKRMLETDVRLYKKYQKKELCPVDWEQYQGTRDSDVVEDVQLTDYPAFNKTKNKLVGASLQQIVAQNKFRRGELNKRAGAGEEPAGKKTKGTRKKTKKRMNDDGDGHYTGYTGYTGLLEDLDEITTTHWDDSLMILDDSQDLESQLEQKQREAEDAEAARQREELQMLRNKNVFLVNDDAAYSQDNPYFKTVEKHLLHMKSLVEWSHDDLKRWLISLRLPGLTDESLTKYMDEFVKVPELLNFLRNDKETFVKNLKFSGLYDTWPEAYLESLWLASRLLWDQWFYELLETKIGECCEQYDLLREEQIYLQGLLQDARIEIDPSVGNDYIDSIMVNPILTKRIAEEDKLRKRWGDQDSQEFDALIRALLKNEKNYQDLSKKIAFEEYRYASYQRDLRYLRRRIEKRYAQLEKYARNMTVYELNLRDHRVSRRHNEQESEFKLREYAKLVNERFKLYDQLRIEQTDKYFDKIEELKLELNAQMSDYRGILESIDNVTSLEMKWICLFERWYGIMFESRQLKVNDGDFDLRDDFEYLMAQIVTKFAETTDPDLKRNRDEWDEPSEAEGEGEGEDEDDHRRTDTFFVTREAHETPVFEVRGKEAREKREKKEKIQKNETYMELPFYDDAIDSRIRESLNVSFQPYLNKTDLVKAVTAEYESRKDSQSQEDAIAIAKGKRRLEVIDEGTKIDA